MSKAKSDVNNKIELKITNMLSADTDNLYIVNVM